MSLDGSSLNVSTIVEIAVPAVGFIGVWFTFRERVSQLWKKSELQEEQHRENQERLTAIELKIERECVKKDDFREMERRMFEKLDKVEHSANNAAFKAAGLIQDMLRNRRFGGAE